MNKKLISFVVCSNGYGHLKRVLSVVNNILKINEKIDVVLFCPETHIKIAREEINFSGMGARCEYFSDLSGNELNWIVEKGVSILKFNNWLKDLAAHPILQKSDLIVSDNHITPLVPFENVKLMGSFIWDDVVNYCDEEVEKVKEIEFEFLQKRKPEMYCLENFAMEAVIGKTNSIQLPWFCEPFETKNRSEEKSVLITGGGTALINEYLFKIANHLLKIGFSETIYLDSKIFELLNGLTDNRIQKFTFDNLGFYNLKAIICRPGIGILTDCVRYGIPPIVINDGFNEEINHNAYTINRLEMGRSFNIKNFTISEITEEIRLILNNHALLSKFRDKIRLQKTDGALKAAELIVNSI